MSESFMYLLYSETHFKKLCFRQLFFPPEFENHARVSCTSLNLSPMSQWPTLVTISDWYSETRKEVGPYHCPVTAVPGANFALLECRDLKGVSSN